ncbi:permease prefix domain 1-containing protein [Streptosporangium sp. KLBMP 9127]|nr:permease prefix domain 1-containing protein [Streptosporangium sp. KLBMP 9127]
MSAGTSLIDDYVDSLGRTLKGPGRPKRDLVAEARDSLLDTADALEEDGLDRVVAERTAVLEFGDVRAIAPGYQRELTVCVGRRLAALLFATVPATALMWSVIWQIFPTAPAGAVIQPGWFVPVARSLDILQLITGVLGAVVLVMLGRGSRRLRRPERVTRALAVFVWAMLALSLVLCAALTFGAHGLDGFDGYPPGLVASLLSWLFWMAQGYGAIRCMRVSRLHLA